MLKIIKRLFSRNKSTKVNKNLPYGKVYDKYGLQCGCPNCEYGASDLDTFVEGFSSPIERKCKNCGTEYLSLQVTSAPKSCRHDW